jgi:AmmeMemoRadiSam system protein B
MVRQPAVAGQFYSAAAETLRADVQRVLPGDRSPRSAVAAIAPHAGMMYSGPVAGAVYGSLLRTSTVILIGPNHRALGAAISVYPQGSWLIPGGEIPIDSAFARQLLDSFPRAQSDTHAHQFEHSLELQIPFLCHGYDQDRSLANIPQVKIVPILLATTEPEACCALGETLARLIGRSETRPLLIASTDMNHYESEEVTRRKDALAIEAIERLDPDDLHARAEAHDISICGLGPVLAVLTAARHLQATRASLARYATSGDISGDHDRVVGYAGFIIL